MRNAFLGLSFLTALLIYPAVGGAQTENTDAPNLSAPPTNYELAARRAMAIETTGVASETETVRNEQPVLIERPEPMARALICTGAPNESRSCDE
ncbi:MAG: hypothetical protein HY659_15785 [Rhizobiales bacterium]|nr:hypothetical protein [Hyphomicrobiales bacterium]